MWTGLACRRAPVLRFGVRANSSSWGKLETISFEDLWGGPPEQFFSQNDVSAVVEPEDDIIEDAGLMASMGMDSGFHKSNTGVLERGAMSALEQTPQSRLEALERSLREYQTSQGLGSSVSHLETKEELIDALRSILFPVKERKSDLEHLSKYRDVLEAQKPLLWYPKALHPDIKPIAYDIDAPLERVSSEKIFSNAGDELMFRVHRIVSAFDHPRQVFNPTDILDIPSKPSIVEPQPSPQNSPDYILRDFQFAHLRSYMHVNVKSQGRVQSFGELIIGGNGNGCAGYGYGKGRSSGEAMTHAKKDLAKNIQYIPLSPDRNLWTEVRGKDKSNRVIVRTTLGKLENKAPYLEGMILELAGIRGAVVKKLGNSNPLQRCRVMFRALADAQDHLSTAIARGTPVLPSVYHSIEAQVQADDLTTVVDPGAIREGGFKKKQEAVMILMNLERLESVREGGFRIGRPQRQ